MSSLDELKRPDLLPVRIAKLLRVAILDGRLKPGERLVEQQLSQEWDVSRTSLREAIRQLAAEGLVTLSDHRGARVSEVSSTSFVELFSARGILEAAAAELAATKATDGEIEELKQYIREMKESSRKGDRSAFFVAGVTFHDKLFEASHNGVLVDLFDQIKWQLRRYQAIMPRQEGLQNQSIAAHSEIVVAIERRDANAAFLLARRHIDDLIERGTANSGLEEQGEDAERD